MNDNNAARRAILILWPNFDYIRSMPSRSASYRIIEGFIRVSAFLTLVIIFLSVSHEVLASPKCWNHASRVLEKSVAYCIDRSRPDLDQTPNEAVVYFFHGIGGSSKSWNENGYEEALRILSAEENFFPFSVVSFDTSDMSFFADAGGMNQGPRAFETWFIEEFMPYIESKHGLCKTRNCRGTAGLSMGGLGALKTALRFSDKFSFAGANSAALSPFNVWEDYREWYDYFNRHEVGALRGAYLLRSVREVFTTWEQSDWNDPAWLVEHFEFSSDMPKLYFDVGGNDYFGFHEGFMKLKEALDQKSVSYESYFDPKGTHELFWDRRWWLMRFINNRFATRLPKSRGARLDAPQNYSKTLNP